MLIKIIFIFLIIFFNDYHMLIKIKNEMTEFKMLLNLEGCTARYYKDNNNRYFLKRPWRRGRWCAKRLIDNEIKTLSKLQKYKYFPKIVTWTNKYIILEYIDNLNKINYNNKPKNIQTQFKKIYKLLKKYNIRHNDIQSKNIFVKKKTIILLDFGLASIGLTKGESLPNYDLYNMRQFLRNLENNLDTL